MSKLWQENKVINIIIAYPYKLYEGNKKFLEAFLFSILNYFYPNVVCYEYTQLKFDGTFLLQPIYTVLIVFNNIEQPQLNN